ncbi:MAG: RHS repeat protein, partial [Bacteroidetes bacterium]
GEISGYIQILKENTSGGWDNFWSVPTSNDTPPQPITTNSIQFLAGNYKILMAIETSEVGEITINTQSLVSCDPNDPSSQYGKVIAGGVRIKQLIHNDGQQDMVQTFEYPHPDDDNKSSGILIQPPRYFFNFNVLMQGNPGIQVPCSFYAGSSTSKSPLGTTQGSHIAYLKTRVYNGTPEQNEGYSAYTYTFAPDAGARTFPFGDLTSYDWKRGHLLSQKDYSKNDPVNPIREVVHEYDFRDNETINNENVTGYRVAYYYAGPAISQFNYVVYEPYDHISRWFYKTRTTEILDGVTKVVNYDYSIGGNHTNPVSISTTNSDGKEHQLKYYYGTDSGAPGCMTTKKIIVPAYKTEKVVDGVVVGGKRTGYNSDCEPVGFYEILEGGSELLRGSISTYTSDGFPEDYTKMGFALEDYTWEDGLLKEKDFLDWHWEYDYDPVTRLPVSMTNIDGQKSFYAYDGFQRLSRSGARVKQGVSTPNISNPTDFHIYSVHKYTYGSPNSISTETIYSDGPTQSVIQELDGLGRHTKTIQNGVIKEHKFFNEFGHLWKEQYLPAEDVYGSTYTLFDYDGSPLNRVVKTTNPDFTSTQTSYDSEGQYYRVTSTDELEQATSVNTDIIGRQAKITNALGKATTYSYFNHGGVRLVQPPTGDPYLYGYDSRKRLENKTIPGGGTQEFTYDDNTDLLKTTTDANLNKLTFDYDSYGREEFVTLNSLDFSGVVIKTTDYGEDDALQSGNLIYMGRVMQTTALMLDGSGTVTNNFDYDAYGRVKNQTETYPLHGGFMGSDFYDFDNQYNHLDWLQGSNRDHSGHSDFDVISGTGYDDFGRVTNQSSIAPAIPGLQGMGSVVEMDYNDRDEILYKKLQPIGLDALQTIDYKYHIRGWLTHINNPQYPLVTGIDICNEPIIGGCAPAPYQVEESVDFSELMQMLCDGEDILIDGLDPCTVGSCVEEIKDYEVTWELSLNHNDVLVGVVNGEFATINLPNYNYLFEAGLTPSLGAIALETDLEAWFDDPNNLFDYEDVIVTVEDYDIKNQSAVYKIQILNTDYDFYSIVVLEQEEVTTEGLQDFVIDWKIRKGISDVIKEVYDSDLNLIPLNYVDQSGTNYTYSFEIAQTPSQGALAFEADLEAWLTAEGFVFNDVIVSVTHYSESEGAYRIEILGTEWSLGNIISTSGQVGGMNQELPLRISSSPAGGGTITVITAKNEFLFGANVDFVLCDELTGGEDENADPGQVVTQADQIIAAAQVANMTFPDVLYKVYFSNGEVRWMFKQELAQVQGLYNRLERIDVEDASQLIRVLPSGQTAQEVDVAGFLTQRSGPTPFDCVTPTECELPDLGCTDSETKNQINSLHAIQSLMCSREASSLAYPITLNLVLLCNGTSAYIMDNYMGQLSGTYLILESIVINGPEDVVDIIKTVKPSIYSQEFEYLDNGNISRTEWQVLNNSVKYYNYTYDDLNRLTSAQYGQKYLLENSGPHGIQIYDDPNYHYSMNVGGYDDIGNIESLNREGRFPGIDDCLTNGQIDKLTYTYGGGRLLAVEDDAPTPGRSYGFDPGSASPLDEYDYDNNGNLIYDPYKGLSIQYNFLNLPKSIGANTSIVYDASGKKWRKITDGVVHEYVNGAEYVDGELLHLMHAEGRFIPADNPGEDGRVEYWLKDHLGNT